MGQNIKFAIALPCYNRCDTLKCLLDSLSVAKYERSVDLILSIDYSGTDAVARMAEKFVWQHGEKRIIVHDKNIGLRNNIILCGDLSEQYDAVIVLEDDLLVSPLFFDYAVKAYDYYCEDNRIAGISLYAYNYTETHRPFKPLTFGYDTYFMQWTSSWGQMWTRQQWKSFKEWYKQHENDNSLENFSIPQSVKRWKLSWKKYHIAYLSDTDKYFVYPSESYTTMQPAIGVHVTKLNVRSPFVMPLCYHRFHEYHFQPIEGCLKYDSFFEPKDLEVEINGVKQLIDSDLFCEKKKSDLRHKYYVTIKKKKECEVLKEWGRVVLPYEMNIMLDYPGSAFFLYRSDSFIREELTSFEKYDWNIKLNKSDKKHLAIRSILRTLKLWHR